MIHLKLDTIMMLLVKVTIYLRYLEYYKKVVNEIDFSGELPKILRDIKGNKVGTISENSEPNILYYTVEKQLIDIDGIEEATGWRDIVVYTIEDNIPKIMFEFDAPSGNPTEEEIQTWLDNEEIGEEFKFVRL